MMNSQNHTRGNSEKPLRWLIWIVIIANWIIVISKYATLPEQVPIHFDLSGRPDNYGSRATIILLPVINTILVVWIAGLKTGIGYFRLPVNGDPKDVSLMMQSICLGMSFIFLMITWKTIAVANGKAELLGGWFLPFVIMVICIPTLFILVRNFRKSRN